MATGKKGLNTRSTTYPTHDTTKNKLRFSLRRMNSFDCSYDDPCLLEEDKSAREVSAEGRARTCYFQYAHTSTASSAPGHKLLRFSDECWCGPTPEQRYISPLKSKQRLNSKYSTVGNVEKLVDWQRQSPDRHSVSPSNSQDAGQRHSRSTERRTGKTGSILERRKQFCSSVSLPPLSKSPPEPVSTVNNSNTPAPSTTVSTEGRRRRSQFRRAWSLFSLSCDKDVQRREKSPPQRILRPPTRRTYRRGVSGLPIQCSTNTLGLAY
ncbi:uncharacterized protein LOC121875776 [Homarus americanus]|uniref:Uncharacterized protein n=1 Tax=Homarus americanus TaxID=6706 RepID=A0A8J5MRP2_HOMAM|nr:uncharacterized protein LOC121875776 [Homarus americanus]KAG7160897.1 hypothetical protein Hamer_G007670 [Homarus americanus]